MSTPLAQQNENEMTPLKRALTPKRLLRSAQGLLGLSNEEEKPFVWISRPHDVKVISSLSEDLVWSGDNFTLGEKIGEGSFAAVYKACHNDTGAIFAIKKVQLQNGTNAAQARRQKESLAREINVLKSCRSPYIVSYFGSYTKQEDGAIYIVMEYLAGGTLHDVIKRFSEDGGLTEQSTHDVLHKVLLGLDYLHSQGFVHRDLKSKNILVDSDGSTRLADFGVSRELQNRELARSMVGTPLFMAPEVMMGAEYTNKADVWSYGICVLEVVNGKIPYHGMPVRELFKTVMEADPPGVDHPKDWSRELIAFVKFILQKDHKMRPTAKMLLETDWIRGIQQDDEATKTTMKMRTLGRAASFQVAGFRDSPIKKVTITPPVKRKIMPTGGEENDEAALATKPKEELVNELLKWKSIAAKLMAEQEATKK